MFVSNIHDYFFFFNDTATTEIYTLSLHDALPISLNIKNNTKVTASGEEGLIDLQIIEAIKASAEKGEIGRAHV